MTVSVHSAAPVAAAQARTSVDPECWPDVARLPRASALRTAIARRVVERAFARVPLRIRHGSTLGVVPRPADGGDRTPTLILHDPAAFHRRVGAGGRMGVEAVHAVGAADDMELVATLGRNDKLET
ncbi:hypothetical protein ACFV5K_07185, partial [Streptomyces sp. NPDC059744]